MGEMNPPTPITAGHDLSQFDCTHVALTNWLKDRSLKNESAGGSRTFVVCADDSKSVIGFYCLAMGAVAQNDAPGAIRRNMPSPIPSVVLGRLAVHREWEKKGIGRGLLKDATLRALAAAQHVGARTMVCHAIDEAARDFYMRHGFVQSPLNPMTVMIGLA